MYNVMTVVVTAVRKLLYLVDPKSAHLKNFFEMMDVN